MVHALHGAIDSVALEGHNNVLDCPARFRVDSHGLRLDVKVDRAVRAAVCVGGGDRADDHAHIAHELREQAGGKQQISGGGGHIRGLAGVPSLRASSHGAFEIGICSSADVAEGLGGHGVLSSGRT